jgi:hypothetical protein
VPVRTRVQRAVIIRHYSRFSGFSGRPKVSSFDA